MAEVLLLRFCHNAFSTVPGFQVGLDSNGISTLVTQFGGNALNVVSNINQKQPGALGGGQFGHALANPLGGAGNHHDPVGEAVFHATFSLADGALGVNFS